MVVDHTFFFFGLSHLNDPHLPQLMTCYSICVKMFADILQSKDVVSPVFDFLNFIFHEVPALLSNTQPTSFTCAKKDRRTWMRRELHLTVALLIVNKQHGGDLCNNNNEIAVLNIGLDHGDKLQIFVLHREIMCWFSYLELPSVDIPAICPVPSRHL